jgi:hypothetical protein
MVSFDHLQHPFLSTASVHGLGGIAAFSCKVLFLEAFIPLSNPRHKKPQINALSFNNLQRGSALESTTMFELRRRLFYNMGYYSFIASWKSQRKLSLLHPVYFAYVQLMGISQEPFDWGNLDKMTIIKKGNASSNQKFRRYFWFWSRSATEIYGLSRCILSWAVCCLAAATCRILKPNIVIQFWGVLAIDHELDLFVSKKRGWYLRSCEHRLF